MASAMTDFLKLFIFPDIEGVYQRELRTAYDQNANIIDQAIREINDAFEKLVTALPGFATAEKAGLVRPDGETIIADENGTLRAAVKVAIATKLTAGIVKPDGDSITVDDDGTIHARVKNAYTKEEIDILLAELSELLVTANDSQALYASVNALMGENTDFSGIGGSLLDANSLASMLIS